MNRLLLSLALFLLLFSATHAQAETTIESLTISLLPQFDDPRLLIIYDATLNQAGSAAIAIPFGVELKRASYRADNGPFIEIPAQFDAGTNARYIRFTTPNRTARIELYQDIIPHNAQRFVDFTLPGQLYERISLRWLVTFPLESSNFAPKPEMSKVGNNHLGMEEFERKAGPLARGELATQTIEWHRESNQPSIQLPNDDATPEAAQTLDLRFTYLSAIFLLGLALVTHGVWKLRQPSKSEQK